jgi:hypothetical protein
MARAAVKAKQAQAAQAQVAVKPSRKQRKHASGGNPNQDLFFQRLRRKQKWVFFGLALVFAISFILLGVGSGNGGGLQQMFNSIGLFGGDDPVAKAQAETKSTDPATQAKGYKDLADAYTAQNNPTLAISSLETYLRLKKKDSAGWAQLAQLKKGQAEKAVGVYQQVQQAIQLSAPGSIFQPSGPLASKLGTNPIDEYYRKQYEAQLSPLAKTINTDYTDSLAAYKQSAKYADPQNANLYFEVYLAAQKTGSTADQLSALKSYVALNPTSPNLKQIEAICKSLKGSCVPKTTK